MRVAESAPNFSWTVVLKGSRWRVTDSNAIARVESALLINVGRVVCAPTSWNRIELIAKSTSVNKNGAARKDDFAFRSMAKANVRQPLESRNNVPQSRVEPSTDFEICARFIFGVFSVAYEHLTEKNEEQEQSTC